MFALSAFNNYVSRKSKALIWQIIINYRLLSTANTAVPVTEAVINNVGFSCRVACYFCPASTKLKCSETYFSKNLKIIKIRPARGRDFLWWRTDELTKPLFATLLKSAWKGLSESFAELQRRSEKKIVCLFFHQIRNHQYVDILYEHGHDSCDKCRGSYTVCDLGMQPEGNAYASRTPLITRDVRVFYVAFWSRSGLH